MDSRCRTSSAIPLLYSLVLLAGSGCSEAVMMSQESVHGGVMTYSYKEDRGGPMGSPYRKPALDAIEDKCGKGSRILREGEVKGYTSSGMGMIEGTEDEARGRRWGIQFECKGADSTIDRAPEASQKGLMHSK